MKILTKAIPILFIAIGIAYFVYANSQIKDLESKVSERESELAKLNAKSASLSSEKEEIEKSEASKQDLVFIKEVGDYIAKLQNDMIKGETDLDTEIKYKKDILSYFDANVPEKAGMDWFDKIPDGVNWSFKTTYGTTDRYIDAVWELDTTDKESNFPVCFVFAKYDASVGKFIDFARYSTVIGEGLIKSEGESAEGYKTTEDSVKDLIDKMEGDLSDEKSSLDEKSSPDEKSSSNEKSSDTVYNPDGTVSNGGYGQAPLPEVYHSDEDKAERSVGNE